MKDKKLTQVEADVSEDIKAATYGLVHRVKKEFLLPFLHHGFGGDFLAGKYVEVVNSFDAILDILMSKAPLDRGSLRALRHDLLVGQKCLRAMLEELPGDLGDWRVLPIQTLYDAYHQLLLDLNAEVLSLKFAEAADPLPKRGKRKKKKKKKGCCKENG